MTLPPYLKPGDTIGIVCPAGRLDAERAVACIDTLHDWGYKVRPGKTLGHAFHYFSGTDEERLLDLQHMLDDPGIRAILCGRGGYGTSRIIDRLDFSRFRSHPKWIIGYSDVTVLHSHLYAVLKTASLHAPMAGAFNEGGPAIESIRSALQGSSTVITAPPYPANRAGVAEAPLVGGNLSLLTHLIGTPSDVDTEGCILFLEDIGEYLYHIDRMLVQLHRNGKLSGLAGLAVGSFTELKDTVVPFGQTVTDIIMDKVSAYNYPVCFDFPVGHQEQNYALRVGMPYRLEVTPENVHLSPL
jgi:muramoyltetrapeptide carboxypeptidase